MNLPVDLIDKLLKGEKRPFIDWREPFLIGKVPDSSKNKAVLLAKDRIVSINETDTKYDDMAINVLKSNKGKTVDAVIIRDEKEMKVALQISKDGKLGVFQGGMSIASLEKLGLYKFSKQKYSFLEAFPAGIEKGVDQIVGYGKQLKAIFSPKTGAYKGVGGFKAIFDIFPASWSWELFWSITAILSIMLGVMNLLPIPALDGGHVLFLLFEMISGKKPSEKFLENAQMVGIVLLITLVVFANGNDIYKAIMGK